jgi:heme exporter protein A
MTQRQVQHPISLEAQGLACGHGDHVLIRGLSLSVEGGTGLLLRGPNGVGKSTLLLTLAGLLPAIEGSIAVAGHDPELGPALHHCGHRNAVRPRLSVHQTLAFWAAINGPTGIDAASALDRVGLARIADLRLLVSYRPVWLLDEPTAALDSEGQVLLATLVEEHLAGGGLVIAATHDDIAVAGLRTLTLGAAA